MSGKAQRWDSRSIEAMQKLKKFLVSKPLLKFPNFNLPFKLTCDASGIAFGCILGQDFDEGDHPIAFASRKLC